MKGKDEKKPLGGAAGADRGSAAAGAEPGAAKRDAASAAGKAANDPGAGKEEEKKPDASVSKGGADAAQVDEKNAGGEVPGDGANGAVTGAQGDAGGSDADSDKAAGKSEDVGKNDAQDGAKQGSTENAVPDGTAGADPGGAPADSAAAAPATADTSAGTEPGAVDAAAAGAGSDAEKLALRRELLAANSRLAAYNAGIAPGMIEDAVTLAMAEAAGDLSAAGIAQGMAKVLERHPEWKVDGEKAGGSKKVVGASNSAGGFKLGVDPQNAASARSADRGANGAKRWNRFK